MDHCRRAALSRGSLGANAAKNAANTSLVGSEKSPLQIPFPFPDMSDSGATVNY